MASANVANTKVVPAGTKVSPYYDDFTESKNFHRILFRPGYPVQARELTQIQTILQNQIERFGNHVFVNGSPVIGGDVYVANSNYYTINLAYTYGSSNTSIVAENFKDKTVVLYSGGSEDSNVKFRVTTVTEGTDTDPPALYGKFLGTSVFAGGRTIKVQGESIYANVAASNHLSFSKLGFLKDSIFYFDGYFVKVPSQSVVAGRSSITPSCRIGLELQDSIVTEESDASLLDPALEASNYQAPGAARYQMNLFLSTRTLDSTDDSKFIELARIEGGEITKLVKFPVYSEIEEVLARRTYDESGNYTVRPFVLNIEDVPNEDYLLGLLSPGKAYIYGYEFETISKTGIDIPKERTTVTNYNYDLNMNYGNYVIVDGLRGHFDTSTMEMVDIHCVPYANVDFTSNTTYDQTKIGSARIRDLEFYSGDVDVDARKYEFYLFDTTFKSISTNLVSNTVNTVTLFDGTNLLTSSNNSYDGATLRIISGPSTGYKSTIVSYNGITKTATLSTDFFEKPDTSSVVSIDFDFAESDSFIINKKYTPGSTSNANCNITTINKYAGDINGPASVMEPSLDTLIFPLPEKNISSNVASIVYYYTKRYDGVEFSTGTSVPITAGTNEDFQGTTVTSNVSSSVMENFFIVVKDKKVSARSNGDIVKATATISSSNPETATFNTSNTDINDTFTATIYSKMQYDIGVLPKLKTFIESNTSTLSEETANVISSSPTGSTANVYLNAGQTVIFNPTKQVGIPESLYVSDVIGIDTIYDLSGNTIVDPGESLGQFQDVTEMFEFNNGQKDSHYDHAYIKLKPNYQPRKGPLVVCYYYYQHTTVTNGGGYFTVDSYPNLNYNVVNNGVSLGDGYSIIPTHTKNNGETIEVRDCIDFRPARKNGESVYPNNNYTLVGVAPPIPTTDFEITSYSYYLARKDIIVLNSDRNLLLIKGTPAKVPVEPTVPNRSMVLYTLSIPPYTEYAKDVKVKYIDNRRYTMRDIGKIDKRVENLEYYVSLNLLEKKAVDVSITDVNGLDRTKYGVFVDSFTGHALGNSNREDYQCAMNFKEGYLQCQANTNGITLEVDESTSTGIKKSLNKITLNYDEVEYLSQPFATKAQPIAEFLYGVFDGKIIMFPEADIWKSTEVDPPIIVTDVDTTEHTQIKVFSSQVNSQSRSGA